MKTKINKLLGVALTLMLLGSLTVGLVVPVAAADGSWSTITTPQAGVLSNYILSSTTGTVAGPGPMEKTVDDSAIYAFFDVGLTPNGEVDNLYKSTDGGVTWTRTGTATDDLWLPAGDATYTITAIATSTQDAKRVYVTDGTDIYRSTDAGSTFVQLLAPPVGITSMAVGYNGDHFIYIGGSDGDVWVLRDAFGYAWTSTNFLAATLLLPAPATGPRNIVAVATSPKFSSEAQPQLMAVSTTAAGGTYVSFSYGGAAWIAVALDDILFAPGIVATAADVAFPGDYASARTSRDFFIGISTGTGAGDVYRIIASTTVDTNAGGPGSSRDITSVAVAGNSGSCKLLAAGLLAPVYHSEDNGATWVANQKALACTTVSTPKYILMDKAYLSNGKALIAVSRGAVLDNASVAQTMDFGLSWTDLSMINTDIARIHNMDVSSNYATDGTIFM